MALLRNALIALVMLSGIGVVASAAFVVVSADDPSDLLNCVVDADGSGFVEITELFNVIDWYFDQARCAAPENDNWTVSLSDNREPFYTVVSQEEGGTGIGPWWMTMTCTRHGTVGVFMGSIWEVIFTRSVDSTETVLVKIDGVLSEQIWRYSAASGPVFDYLSYTYAVKPILAEHLLTADRVEFIIPTGGDDYVVEFAVSGLDRHIDNISEVCG